MKPRYSVLIPTRSRREYLGYAIGSVLSQYRDDVEVIVSNNYSTDETAVYLRELADPRVKVIEPPTELTMSEHYEYLLSQANGEWVAILGDDDALMPDFFCRLDSLTNKYQHASIISSERAYYFWAGCEGIYGDIVVSYRKSNGCQLRSTKRDLLGVLAGIRSCFDMPQIYTSCVVRNSLVQQIKEKSGNRFYHSIIPDMYSAVALCLSSDHYVRVNNPLFWIGTSNKSMGIGTRIYDESNQKRVVKTDSHQMALNPNISIDLHSAGFGSLYFYEAVLQCPLSSSVWKGKLITSIVYSGMIVDVGRRPQELKQKNELLLDKINQEIKKNGLNPFFIKILSLFIAALITILSVAAMPRRLWRQITKDPRKNLVFSMSREDYPDIAAASDAVKALISS
jgi:glycosyltransferase involved in cell wall biosynthesis